MTELVIGFTGTRQGMTELQKAEVRELVESRIGMAGGAHGVIGLHGDAIGADAEFDAICRKLGVKTQCRPCTLADQRAYTDAEVVADPEPPLERNRRIVDHSDLMIGAPAEQTEQHRGGTWATIRRARSERVSIFVVYPNGEVTPS